MSIEPIIHGVVAKNAHPLGCEKSVLQQIEYVTKHRTSTEAVKRKRVLVLGASSGLGLAARIALTFGDAQADTIGVSLDSAPTANKTGNAGFYNNFFFSQHAQQTGHVAVNIQGDVFSQKTKEDVIEAIETYFEGEVDLIIYSIAASKRITEQQTYVSAIKPIKQTVNANFINFATDSWTHQTIEAASQQDIDSTLKTMGGEDWEQWIDTLINAESVAQGCQTIAFSYVGSEVTHPIYLDGTLGYAKVDLHQSSHSLNRELANFGGSAFAVACQALVTRSSVVIPNLCPYLLALKPVLEKQGKYEDCIHQMQRLFYSKLIDTHGPDVDRERLIRLDDHELDPEVQKQVCVHMQAIDKTNFQHSEAYKALKKSFLQLNGFSWDDIDYTKDIRSDMYLIQ
jgi:enoyl-[acyl-carrier protein] reductase / trans-2-enoyl-CoA reductase (NAD+)